MKFILAAIIALSATQASAALKHCTSEDGRAKARISEIYIDILLIRRIFSVNIDDERVYYNLFGRLDDSNPFTANSGAVISTHSGGMKVSYNGEDHDLECRLP